MQLASKAVNDLCDAHGKALSQSFGNFDRVVGLGWLLADAVGAPLISRADAYAIGLKVKRIPDEVKGKLAELKRGAQRKAAKLKVDDPERKELEDEAAEAKVMFLRKTVELPLPMPSAQPPASTGTRDLASASSRGTLPWTSR